MAKIKNKNIKKENLKSKQINKKVAFHFYKGEIQNKEKSAWKAENIFKYILEKNMETLETIKGYKIELEPKTLEEENGKYFFQITKLREDMLPAKKRVGEEKEDLELKDNEYIGEFTSILYDSTNSTFMIQINRYGVGIEIITEFLRKIRKRYFELKNQKLEEDIDLKLIVDSDRLKTLPKSKSFQKITIKSSKTSLEKISEDIRIDNLKALGKCFENFGDVEFEINISAKVIEHKEIEKNLGKKIIEEGIKIVKKLKKDDSQLNKTGFGMSATIKEKEDSLLENIDFLVPKMRKEINFKVEPRKSLGKDNVKSEMLRSYAELKSKIDSILLNK